MPLSRDSLLLFNSNLMFLPMYLKGALINDFLCFLTIELLETVIRLEFGTWGHLNCYPGWVISDSLWGERCVLVKMEHTTHMTIHVIDACAYKFPPLYPCRITPNNKTYRWSNSYGALQVYNRACRYEALYLSVGLFVCLSAAITINQNISYL